VPTGGPYPIGQTVEVTVTINDSSTGQLFSPPGVSIVVREPVDGSETTLVATEVSLGVWRVFYVAIAHGRHYYRAVGLGVRPSAAQAFFDVEESRVTT
jgi:hypothetical protein